MVTVRVDALSLLVKTNIPKHRKSVKILKLFGTLSGMFCGSRPVKAPRRLQHKNKINKNNKNIFQNIFPALSTRVAVAILFFAFFPLEVPSALPLPRALQLDFRVLSAFKRNYRELSIELFNLPKHGGGMGHIKQRARGPSWLRLKAYIIRKLSN